MKTFRSPRREFIKNLALLATYSTFADKTLEQLVWADITPLAVNDGVVHLPLTSHPVLANDFGSVRIRLPGTTTAVPNVVITRLANSQFAVVDARCTHEGTLVNTYNRTANALICTQHGSRFSATGQVTLGPANRPLTSFPAVLAGNTLRITVPNMAYRVDIESTATRTGSRIQLTFPTASNFKYALRQKLNFTSPDWVPVTFANSASSEFTLNEIQGTGSPISIWAPRTAESSFFSIVRF